VRSVCSADAFEVCFLLHLRNAHLTQTLTHQLEIYMSRLSDIQQKRMDYLLSYLRKRFGKTSLRILDIGCQTGELCSLLKQEGHEPHGLEVQTELIKQCRNEFPEIPFSVADSETRLPFEDHSFDIVFSGDVIEHIRFTDVFVNEINRVLKIGGLCALTTPLHNRIKSLLIVLLKFDTHFDPEFPHLRFYTRATLAGVLQRRGFTIESVGSIGRIPIVANALFMVARKNEDKAVMSQHRY
jgi:SAM-dependent methyltransferase